MALNNCTDCPQTCLGNVVPSDCVEYNSQSLKTYLDKTGTTAPSSDSGSSDITTDEITSKSLVRNPGSVCGSKILNRTYEYTLTTSQTGSIFGWNLSDVVKGLPTGYSASTTRVKLSGSTVNGKNVIADSRKQSGGVNINTDRYPVTVDVLVRVTSPCGDIDMESTLILSSPAKTGKYSAVLSVKDLNPATGEVVLTEQLDGLEAQVYDLGVQVTNLPDTTVELEKQQVQIDALDSAISNASTLSVNYESNGSKFTDELGDVLTALYSEINSLKTTVVSLEVEVASLRAAVDSINATS